ncbi:MAG: DNA repair protein RecO [Clostridiales bacterium]|nr:DNA repair protein RecO [Clostridiales bacterium]
MDFSANALVLAEHTVGDYDKRLELLCEGIGRIGVWAPGAKRVKSPLLAACAPFCYGHYTFRQKGDRITLRSAELQESFFALWQDLEYLALAGYLAELCRTLCMERQPEDLLLRLTLNALFAAAERRAPPGRIKAAYELRALSESGYLPELAHCVACGREQGLCAFSPLQGGLLCADCAQREPTAVPAAPPVVEAMRFLSGCDPRRLCAFTLPDAPQRSLEEISEAYTLSTLGHSPKTLLFYRQMQTIE